jgi:hypothetical protein
LLNGSKHTHNFEPVNEIADPSIWAGTIRRYRFTMLPSYVE